MDTVTQLYPMRVAAAEQIRSGTPPLWLPNIFSGTPLLANPQISVLYPPQVLFYLAPGPTTNGLVCLFHYVLAGWGAYFLVRRLTGGGVLPALFAAVTFQFGAMLVSRIALTPHLYTTAWIPWMLWACERAVREHGVLPGRSSVLVAVFLAFQILAGSPQISYYTALALVVVWVGWGAAECRSRRALWELLVRGALTGLLAALLASAQLLPTLEFLRESARTPIRLERLQEQALGGGFVWRALVGFTGPEIEDTDSINAIGPGAMLLALVALLARRRRRLVLTLWGVSILGYLLSLGVLAAFWKAVLPLWGSFHAPRRALILWSVCGPILAGVGAHQLAVLWRARGWPPTAFVGLLVVLTTGTWWMLPRLERVFTTPDRFRPDTRIVEAIGEARFLALDPGFAYSYDSRRPDYGVSMMPDLACWHGTYDVNGYDPLVVQRYAHARNVACSSTGVFYPSHGVFLSNPASTLLRILNVEYLVGRYDLYDPGRLIPGVHVDRRMVGELLEPVIEDDFWPLYRYRDARPLAWTVERVVGRPNALGALTAALDQAEPHRVAFVEDMLEFASPPAPPLAVERLDARRFRLRFAEPLRQETMAVVSTVWMPGWRARSAGGESLGTLPANGLLVGVLVPAGANEVVVSYLPGSVLRGVGLSLAGLLAALALVRRKPFEKAEVAGKNSAR
jgi:predicted membrane protein